MSCYSCAKRYGLFTKEVGCPNCGFSFCGKCLKYKSFVPKLNAEKDVCKNCCALLKSGKMNEEIAPPDAFLKSSKDHTESVEHELPALMEKCLRRLENLDNPSRPPITVYKQDHRMLELKSGLTEEDKKIAERLEKLREDRNAAPIPSDTEMRRRLAILKGENPDITASTNKMHFPTNDIRSDEEKAQDLLKQYMEEQGIADTIPENDVEIEKRLAALRVKTTDKDAASRNKEKFSKENKEESVSNDGSSSDEEVAAITLADKYMEEASLDANFKSKRDTPSPLVDKDGNELPWCIICNEDARLRCPECDDDLYCGFCWRDCHKEWKKLHHRPTAYFPPKKPEDDIDSDKDD